MFRHESPGCGSGLLHYVSATGLVRVAESYSGSGAYLTAGPRLDLLVGYPEPDRRDLDYGDFRHLLLGYTVGAGVRAPTILTNDFFVELLYHGDLTNSLNVTTPGQTETIRNRSVELRIGLVY